MQTTKLVFIISILFSTLLLSAVNAQAVSDEARRHMARGEAAVEMAKAPEDYEQAIKEFQEAARLAPTWSAPYYKLGLVQEKAGKFREAITSLNRYLQLAPNAPDAAKVKELIYKLDYKAEQVLLVWEIVDVLVSFAHPVPGWQQIGETDVYPYRAFLMQALEITRVIDSSRVIDYSSVRVRTAIEYSTPRGIDEKFNTLSVTGPILKYTTWIDRCRQNPCPVIIVTEIEVVSKTHVKVRQEAKGLHDANTGKGLFKEWANTYLYEYRKK